MGTTFNSRARLEDPMLAIDEELNLLEGAAYIRVYGLDSKHRCKCGSGSACGSPGKHPIDAGWKTSGERDLSVVKGWLQAGHNIGILTGASGLLVVDLDPRNDGEEPGIELLQRRYGELPPTLTAHGGEGAHYYYSVDRELDLKDAMGVRPGVDLKAAGFVVCPPSGHASGAPRSWGGSGQVARAPGWLQELCLARTKPKVGVGRASHSVIGSLFAAAGMVKGESEDGSRLFVECPWADEHSAESKSQTDSVVFAGGKGSRIPQGWFKCLHSHCASRKQGEVWEHFSRDHQEAALARFRLEPEMWEPAEASSGAHLAVIDGEGQVAQHEDQDVKWYDLLERDAKGQVVIDEPNVAMIIRNDELLKGSIHRCDFTGDVAWKRDIEVHGYRLSGALQLGEHGRNDIIPIASKITRYLSNKKRVPTQIVETALLQVASENSTHPVRAYLNSLKWDGQDRSGSLNELIGAEALEINNVFLMKTLIAGVARVFEPGCKVDTCLILESSHQGAGKSTLCKILARSWELSPEPKDWFVEVNTLGTREDIMKTRGRWIVELPELEALGKVSADSAKSHLSIQSDTYREPYARKPGTHPRQFIFIGTTNREDYLSDSTGARRFWPVRITGMVRTQELEASMDQLWAQAVAMYRSGVAWRLDEPWQLKVHADVTKERYEDPTWVLIAEKKGWNVTTAAELADCAGVPKDRQRKVLRAIGEDMALAGWRTARWGRMRRRVYYRPGPKRPSNYRKDIERLKMKNYLPKGDIDEEKEAISRTIADRKEKAKERKWGSRE